MITVIKQDHTGIEVWRYPGFELERSAERLLVTAQFNRDDFLFNGMTLNRGDLFLEAYYRNKWYNIMEIYDRDNSRLKGWYCNITMPPKINRWQILYRDLALDLLVHADRRQMVLDEDEFDALQLPGWQVEEAWHAMDELKRLFEDSAFRLRK